jgi:glycosidase
LQTPDNKRFIFFGNIEIAKTIVFLFCLSLSFNSHAFLKQSDLNAVNPPHWWVGMPSAELQVLLYAEGISSGEVSIKQDGNSVVITQVERFANPNYLNLHFDLSKVATAQSFEIRVKGKGFKYFYDYQLKSREEHKRGLDPSDVIYLITPDRFANGDPENDIIEGYNQTTLDRSEPYERHGGDMQGILDNIDYIQNLGMTALWPNPLLENNQPHESYHGYAFTDYYKIDPRFGSNELYGALIDSLHNRGMKIIQDVVYNHIGNEHFLYRDLPDSSWFHFWPEYTQTNYRAPSLMDPYASAEQKRVMTDGWFDKHMPDLNQQNRAVAQYLIQQTLWWIEEFKIDALRIDTYAYPDQDFMRNWGSAVKEAFPDIFLFAETWVHGETVQGWFLGSGLGPSPNHVDGLTDFQVYYAINDALTKDQGWTEGISRLYYTLSADYIYEEPNKMVTFVDNHDLARFFGYVNSDLDKMKIGLGMLFTLRGIPSIYYGTEILMKETDGHGKIREDFLGGWPTDSLNKFTEADRTSDENAIWNYIQKLSKLRQNSTAIQTGKLTQFIPKDGLYVYFRYDTEETYIIVVNVSEEERELELSNYSELLGNKGALIDLNGNNLRVSELESLPPMSIHIFKAE